MRLDESNLPALAQGCAVLAAGGGGDPRLGLLMALAAVREHGPVDVLDAGDLPAEGLVMPCGLVGAPTLAEERVWNGGEGQALRRAVEAELRGGVAAMMCFSIGGANGVLPVTWAARAGLPLVDADGMGRTFPRLHQQSMHLAGVTASPVVMTDCRGDTIVIRAGDDRRAERLARRAADGLGGVSAAAMCCMPGERVRDAAIPGSVSLAVELGRALGADGMEARCAALAGAVGAVVLIEGKVLDVEYSQAGSAPRGSTTIDGTGAYAGRQLRIELQNEFLVALEDGAVQAAVPDLISVLSADDGDPIGTESLRRARRVVVVAVAAPQLWRTDEALDVAGPSAFGYQLDGA